MKYGMGITLKKESVSSFDDLFHYNFDSLFCSTNDLCICFLPLLEYCVLVAWRVSLQRQTFPSLTMNHTTTTPTNTNYFSKLDNATHCLSLSLTMNPLILTMSPTAANLLLLCTHPLSHIAPPHLPLRSSYRVYIMDPPVHIYELF